MRERPSAAQTFETLVRYRAHGAAYSKPSVSLHHRLHMSHNAVVHCLRERTLVAFGGMAHAPDSADWQGNDLGIWRITAPAMLPPLAWSAPQLVLTGDPNTTGCVDVVREGPSCEFDGKLSVVRFRRSTLLFTRSNLAPSGGGRHVQMARSTDGIHGWDSFQQLQIAGVTHGAPEVNIYFLAVRTLRPATRAGRQRQPPRLLGLFPGVLGGELGAGVFTITSVDGVHWTEPRKLLASAVDGQRTRDYPVDGAVPLGWWWPSAGGAASRFALGSDEQAVVGTPVRFALQTDVDLRAHRTPSTDGDCDASIGRPIFCGYHFAIPDANPEESSTSYPATSTTPVRNRPIRHLMASLRAYLHAVYPAARQHIDGASKDELVRLHAGLDYHFAPSSTAAPICHLFPRSNRCSPSAAAAHRSISGKPSSPLIPSTLSPYLPPGAYFVAAHRPTGRSANATPFMEASYVRHAAPVVEFARPIIKLISSWAAKVGPAPSWTSPLAATRYALFPHGLHRPTSSARIAAEPAAAVGIVWAAGPRKNLGSSHAGVSAQEDSAITFEPRHHPRVVELLSLRDGDLVEVEQWGGWAAADCPPICGLWANIWRGTGLAMRVTNPRVSLSKATAVVEMLLALGERSPSALTELARAINLLRPARTLLKSHARTPLAVCVAAVLLMEHPCEGAAAGEALSRTMELWLATARQTPPREMVAVFQTLGGKDAGQFGHADTSKQNRLRQVASDSEQRFGLYWLYGICGVGGPLRRTGYGWDGLLALLACLLGHHTIVLAASPNDNGLLHQELVDFELPPPYGWPSLASAQSVPNALRECQRHFDIFQADKAQGAQAKQARRRELHRFWLNSTRHGPKFVLPRRVPAATKAVPVLSTTPPHADSCPLRFGASVGEVAGAVDACELAGHDEDSPPTAGKACWAWCDGALSQIHASVSLLHVHDAGMVDSSDTGLALVATAEAQMQHISTHRAREAKKRLSAAAPRRAPRALEDFTIYKTCSSHVDCIDASAPSFCDDQRHCVSCARWDPRDASASIDGRRPSACDVNVGMISGRRSSLRQHDLRWPIELLSRPMRLCAPCLMNTSLSGATRKCPRMAHTSRARALHLDDVDCTERYAQLVQCAGQGTWLFSRIEHFDSREGGPEPQPHTQLIARELISSTADDPLNASQPAFGPARLAMEDDRRHKLAANAAITCTGDGNFLLFGGGEGGTGTAWLIGQPRQSGTDPRASRRHGFRWSRPMIAWSGDKSQTGCIEARPHMPNLCEYDGKLSVLRYGAHTLAFTRSNLYVHGGRHVQMTSSPTGVEDWTPFQQLSFEHYTTAPHNNLYFASVREVSTGLPSCEPMLLGLFPGSIGGLGGVYVSVSTNGVQWGALQRLFNSEVHASWRTADHPVDGAVASTDAGHLSLVLQHGVSVPHRPYPKSSPGEEPTDSRAQAWCNAHRPPLYCEYTFPWSVTQHNASHMIAHLGGLKPWLLHCSPHRQTDL